MPENEDDFLMTIDLGDDTTIELNPNKIEKDEEVDEQVAEVVETETTAEEKKDKKPQKKSKKKASVKIDTPEKEEEPPASEPETINVDELKDKAKHEDVTIDFMNSEQSEAFINKKTKESELDVSLGKSSEENASNFKDKTVDEVKAEIAQEEHEQSTKFKAQDYEEIALIIVDVFDMLMAALLRWYAKDTSDQPYSLTKRKKERVAYNLSLLLIKHQKKWSIEFMFCLTLIAIYSGPVLAARDHRKKVKSGEAPKRKKGTQPKN